MVTQYHSSFTHLWQIPLNQYDTVPWEPLSLFLVIFKPVLWGALPLRDHLFCHPGWSLSQPQVVTWRKWGLSEFKCCCVVPLQVTRKDDIKIKCHSRPSLIYCCNWKCNNTKENVIVFSLASQPDILVQKQGICSIRQPLLWLISLLSTSGHIRIDFFLFLFSLFIWQCFSPIN